MYYDRLSNITLLEMTQPWALPDFLENLLEIKVSGRNGVSRNYQGNKPIGDGDPRSSTRLGLRRNLGAWSGCEGGEDDAQGPFDICIPFGGEKGAGRLNLRGMRENVPLS